MAEEVDLSLEAIVPTPAESSAGARIASPHCSTSRRGKRISITTAVTIMPQPLGKGCLKEVATLKDVPTSEALASWLQNRGLSTETWGQNDTKGVDKFWKEIRDNESGLELWLCEDGKLQVLRVTHVLRAKVCSRKSHAKGVFLFNTWQQYGDGRKRFRNGLLSEKLTVDETPLEEHLHEVCERAVTEEEMARVVSSKFVIKEGVPVPEYDSHIQCPLHVEEEFMSGKVVEIEPSKSYPGLLTMYNLYTVDIICRGLPDVDFNTLEFEHEDQDGHRRLKYVHAWIWLDWPQIQRCLFEGSALKERMKKGTFMSVDVMAAWLEPFGLNLDEWGKNGNGSVLELFDEVENEAAWLEVWSRQDGVSQLMRVVHVLQVIVRSTDPCLAGKILVHTWSQRPDGFVRTINRLISKKMSSGHGNFDESRFKLEAERMVKEKFHYLTDASYRVDPEGPQPRAEDLEPSGIRVCDMRFVGHHTDHEESPSYPGMKTMYHLYCVELECEGLPVQDFNCVDIGRTRTSVQGWRWAMWQEFVDILHASSKDLQRREAARKQLWQDHRRQLEACRSALACLGEALEEPGSASAKMQDLFAKLSERMESLEETAQETDQLEEEARDSGAWTLPPSIVSMMASDSIIVNQDTDELLFVKKPDS